MKKNKGITLLELLIAGALLFVIIGSLGGIYVSGWNFFREAQYHTQAQQNAMVAVMHMGKQLRGAGIYIVPLMIIIPGDPIPNTTLLFRVYEHSTLADLQAGPNITSRYTYDRDAHQLIYEPDISGAFQQIVGRHIHGFTRSIIHGGVGMGPGVEFTITSRDNRDSIESQYTLTTRIISRFTSITP